jgi:hypothetical protein
MSAWTTVARRAKPESGTLDRIFVTTTGPKPSAAGKSANPNPAPGYGDHPTGHVYLVNNTGTHPLGDTDFAKAIWRAVADPPENSRADRPDALSRSPGGSQIR